MSDLIYENLPVALRQREESVEVGFVLHGAFFAFGGFKTGGFHADLQEALEAEAAAKHPPKK